MTNVTVSKKDPLYKYLQTAEKSAYRNVALDVEFHSTLSDLAAALGTTRGQTIQCLYNFYIDHRS